MGCGFDVVGGGMYWDILMGTILTTSILTLRNCFYFPAAALPAGVRSQTGWPGLDQPQYSWKIPSSC